MLKLPPAAREMPPASTSRVTNGSLVIVTLAAARNVSEFAMNELERFGVAALLKQMFGPSTGVPRLQFPAVNQSVLPPLPVQVFAPAGQVTWARPGVLARSSASEASLTSLDALTAPPPCRPLQAAGPGPSASEGPVARNLLRDGHTRPSARLAVESP